MICAEAAPANVMQPATTPSDNFPNFMLLLRLVIFAITPMVRINEIPS